MPVDPARMTFGQRLESQTLEATRQQYGLDQSLGVQLLYYLRDVSPIAILDPSDEIIEKYTIWLNLKIGSKLLVFKAPFLRVSYQSGRPVWEILRDALPQTLILAIAALCLAAPLGILLGVLGARYRGTIIDESLIALSVLGYSVPSYVSALVFSIIFGFWLGEWTGLPVQGSLYALDDAGDVHLKLSHLILPALALGIRPIAVIMQITRGAMISEKSMNYMTVARAKGLSPLVLEWKHALRNAANPIITSISGWFAALLAGSFFVESIFNYNGIGKVTVNALLMFDVPVLIGAIITVSGIYVLINIGTDLIYRSLDVKLRSKS